MPVRKPLRPLRALAAQERIPQRAEAAGAVAAVAVAPRAGDFARVRAIRWRRSTPAVDRGPAATRGHANLTGATSCSSTSGTAGRWLRRAGRVGASVGYVGNANA